VTPTAQPGFSAGLTWVKNSARNAAQAEGAPAVQAARARLDRLELEIRQL
jgi:hypothetical protein